MNDIIYVLTYGKFEEAAQLLARVVASKKMVHSQKEIGNVCYVEFSKDGLHQLGKNYRRPIPPVLQVSTSLFPTEDKRGLDMVNSVIEENRRRFKESMVHIRNLVETYMDDQLFCAAPEDKGSDDPSLFHSWCSIASGYHPDTDAKLYDFNGDAIWSPRHLQCLLNPSYLSLHSMDEGDDPYWGPHIWSHPLWAVPFLRIEELPILY